MMISIKPFSVPHIPCHITTGIVLSGMGAQRWITWLAKIDMLTKLYNNRQNKVGCMTEAQNPER